MPIPVRQYLTLNLFVFLCLVNIAVKSQCVQPDAGCSTGCSGKCPKGDSLLPKPVVLTAPSSCPGNFTLVFEDNFDGIVLDQNNWKPHLGWSPYYIGYFNFATINNLEFNNGILKLYAKHEPGYYSPGIHSEFTTGVISTIQSYTNGFFEISCKIPNIDGLFPAFWLIGNGGCYREIDVFELNNDNLTSSAADDNKRIFMTRHTDADCSGSCGRYGSGFNYCDIDYSLAFHIYSVEWDEYKIIWRIDGDVKRSDYRYQYFDYLHGLYLPITSCDDILSLSYSTLVLQENPNFPVGPMNVIINTAVTNFGTEANPQWRGTYPSIMEVDYIKIYQREGSDLEACCPDYKLYENTTDLPTLTHVKDYIKAGNDAGIPNAFGSVKVKTGETVVFRAGNYIELGPGFFTEPGAFFIAEPEECLTTSDPGNDPTGLMSSPSVISESSPYCVKVQDATSYSVIVQNWLGIDIFEALNQPITSNYACIWDGTCQKNCLGFNTFHCNNKFKIFLGLFNCNETVNSVIDIIFHCPSGKTNIASNDSSNDKNNLISNSDILKNTPQSQISKNKSEISNLPVPPYAGKSSIIISPNPTTGRTVIYFSPEQITSATARLEITDVIGRKVFEKNPFGQGVANYIDLSHLQKGVYFLKIFTEDEVRVEKVVIE